MPGDPIQAMIATSARAGGQSPVQADAVKASLKRYYGLDRPLPEQFGHYIAGLATGDLGVSYRERVQVSGLLAARLPWTLLLLGTSVFLAAVVGMAWGIHSGWRAGRRADQWLLALFTGIREIPPFFLASVMLLIFAVKLQWVPLGGGTSVAPGASAFGRALDIGHHLLLPATLMAGQLAAAYYLMMRAGMVQERGAGYLTMGKAKGLPESRLKYAYAARNALLPVVTLMTLEVSSVVAGLLLFIESVFNYPGLGRLIFQAIAARDYPVLQGAFLVLSLTVVTINFLSEIAYNRLDPRTVAA